MDWEWAKLIAEVRKVLDGAWSECLAWPQIAHDVPIEHKFPIVDRGYAFRQQPEGLNATS